MIGSLATDSKKILFEAWNKSFFDTLYLHEEEWDETKTYRDTCNTMLVIYNQSLKDVASLYIFVSRELYSDYKR